MTNVQKCFFCIDCGTELDQNDVDANLNMYGVFKSLCSDCCGDLEDTPPIPRSRRMD